MGRCQIMNYSRLSDSTYPDLSSYSLFFVAARILPSCVMPPLETSPPTDLSGGVFYLRIVLSPEEASRPWVFLNSIFSRGGVVSTSPNPQAGGPPLVGCPRLLIQFIRSYPPYQKLILHPQPEDAPCHGDTYKTKTYPKTLNKAKLTGITVINNVFLINSLTSTK